MLTWMLMSESKNDKSSCLKQARRKLKLKDARLLYTLKIYLIGKEKKNNKVLEQPGWIITLKSLAPDIKNILPTLRGWGGCNNALTIPYMSGKSWKKKMQENNDTDR